MKKLIKGAMAGAVVMMLAGCQLYNEALKPDRQEERYIQATRKGEILNGLKTEAVIVATRLNEFDPEQFKSSEGEYFSSTSILVMMLESPKIEALTIRSIALGSLMVASPSRLSGWSARSCSNEISLLLAVGENIFW